VEEWTVPGIGTHDSNGRYQQAIAPGGIGRQESSPPIQLDVSIGMPVPQGPSGLILLSVIRKWTVPGIGTHHSNGRYQQAIAPGGIGRQESSPPIQLDVSIGMPVPQGPSGLILLSVIHIESNSMYLLACLFLKDLLVSFYSA
jgi:hypothetical protein